MSLSPKAKIKKILEKLGYVYVVSKYIDGRGDDVTIRSMKHPKMYDFKELPLEDSKDIAWIICHLASEKIPDFIDYVYPFPADHYKLIDRIYNHLHKDE